MITPLKLERIKSGLKQVEVAKITGIDRQRLCMAENGWITMRPEEIQKIQRVISAHGKQE
jgi:DNA-binding XRE family transcriptional regulator